MAHPLNRPRFDAALGRVVEGYGILQPRVTPALPVEREGSLFLRVFSSATGIDPYAAAVSDVYQDLFGEGSYTGKGIYDVDAFEAALHGRVPESTLLSHDLFEGIFARAGLASDVEVVEEFPPRYDVAALRHHRWARGDWQLLPWIFGRRPDGPIVGRWQAFPRSAAGRCSTTCGGRCPRRQSFVALIAGWTMPLEERGGLDRFHPIDDRSAAAHSRDCGTAPRRARRDAAQVMSGALGAELRLALIQSGLMIIFLAHQAWLMGDAIVRTLVRLCGYAPPPARMGPGGAGGVRAASDGRCVFYRRMSGALVIGVCGDRGGLVLGTAHVAAGRRICRRLVRLSGRRRFGRAVAPGREPPPACRG